MTTKNQKPVFTVEEWNAVAFWDFQLYQDTCAICKNKLLESCIKCRHDVDKKSSCSLSTGTCGHSFHFHCIVGWLRDKKSAFCPIGKEVWDFDVDFDH